jgi:hypothetical protein
MLKIPVRLHCERCEHSWIKKSLGDPVRCPKCTSVLWNVSKKEPAK